MKIANVFCVLSDMINEKIATNRSATEQDLGSNEVKGNFEGTGSGVDEFDKNRELVYKSLRVFLMGLKIAGMYFEVRHEETSEPADSSNAGGTQTSFNIENSGSKKSISKLQRCKSLYPTTILVIYWLNFFRMFTLFNRGDKFGPGLFFKVIMLTHCGVTACYSSAFYYACRSGRMDKLITGLSQVKGVDVKYLSKKATSITIIAFIVIFLDSCLLVCGLFEINWMFEAASTPFNTWIKIENQTAIMAIKLSLIILIIYMPATSFFANSFTMLMSTTIRKCFKSLEKDLKHSLNLIPGVYRKVGKKKICPFSSLKIVHNSVGVSNVDVSEFMTESKHENIEINVSKQMHVGNEHARNEHSENIESESEFVNYLKNVNLKSFVLNECLKNHEIQMFSLNSFEYFRQRYQSISRLVRKGDGFICIFNVVGIVGYLAESIMILYTLLWHTCEFTNYITYMVIMVTWCLASISSLFYIAFAGILVNSSANRVFEKLHDIDLLQYPPNMIGNLLVFLNRMNTESVGFTVLRMFTIDRNTIITITGMFVTYFLIIYQLNPNYENSECYDLSSFNNRGLLNKSEGI